MDKLRKIIYDFEVNIEQKPSKYILVLFVLFAISIII